VDVIEYLEKKMTKATEKWMVSVLNLEDDIQSDESLTDAMSRKISSLAQNSQSTLLTNDAGSLTTVHKTIFRSPRTSLTILSARSMNKENAEMKKILEVETKASLSPSKPSPNSKNERVSGKDSDNGEKISNGFLNGMRRFIKRSKNKESFSKIDHPFSITPPESERSLPGIYSVQTPSTPSRNNLKSPSTPSLINLKSPISPSRINLKSPSTPSRVHSSSKDISLPDYLPITRVHSLRDVSKQSTKSSRSGIINSHDNNNGDKLNDEIVKDMKLPGLKSPKEPLHHFIDSRTSKNHKCEVLNESYGTLCSTIYSPGARSCPLQYSPMTESLPSPFRNQLIKNEPFISDEDIFEKNIIEQNIFIKDSKRCRSLGKKNENDVIPSREHKRNKTYHYIPSDGTNNENISKCFESKELLEDTYGDYMVVSIALPGSSIYRNFKIQVSTNTLPVMMQSIAEFTKTVKKIDPAGVVVGNDVLESHELQAIQTTCANNLFPIYDICNELQNELDEVKNEFAIFKDENATLSQFIKSRHVGENHLTKSTACCTQKGQCSNTGTKTSYLATINSNSSQSENDGENSKKISSPSNGSKDKNSNKSDNSPVSSDYRIDKIEQMLAGGKPLLKEMVDRGVQAGTDWRVEESITDEPCLDPKQALKMPKNFEFLKSPDENTPQSHKKESNVLSTPECSPIGSVQKHHSPILSEQSDYSTINKEISDFSIYIIDMDPTKNISSPSCLTSSEEDDIKKKVPQRDNGLDTEKMEKLKKMKLTVQSLRNNDNKTFSQFVVDQKFINAENSPATSRRSCPSLNAHT